MAKDTRLLRKFRSTKCTLVWLAECGYLESTTMQSLEAACKEADKTLEKVKICSLPLSRPQDSNNSKYFSIFEKLEELYREESFKILNNTNNDKPYSFLLEKLASRERLNKLILNLYPEKNEYSFTIRMGSIVDDISIGNNIDDNLIKMQWQPDDEILGCIDNEEIPYMLSDILEEEYPELFYSGCIIVEVRDYIQINSQVSCETHHVLLKPSTRSLLSDFNSVIEKTCSGWSEEEKFMLESELTNATNPVLCLDPAPVVSIITNRIHHQRNLFSTHELKKCAQRFALVSRKRKRDAITPNPGLELHDFILKKRLKSTKNSGNSLSKLKSPRMVLPAPSLELKFPMAAPDKVNTSKYRSYAWPKETRNCQPYLIEEYILDTERQCKRDKNKIYHLHIKLSILQRPFNSEYLGELYLDVDYEEGKTNGASSRFTLGSRSYVDKFIRQFTDMITEKGRKSMNIVKQVPGHEPKIICISGAVDKVHAAQQGVQTAQLQATQSQIMNPSSLSNGTASPNVVLVQGNQSSTVQNNTSVPILQAQLQSTSQPKMESRHTANPDITALVASFISEAQQIEQKAAAEAAAAAAQQQAAAAAAASLTTNNANAAILSLLNTSPVNSVNSAASAAVANAITNSNALGSVVGLGNPQTVQQLNQKKMPRKMTIANVPRVLNHGNVIAVNNNAVVSMPQQVRISALASQLASPPVNVLIATANTSQQQPQGQTFTLTTVSGAGFPTNLNYTTVPLSATNQLNQMKTQTINNQRLMTAGVSNLRAIPSKQNDSTTNVSNTSVPGLSALLVNTPAADHPIPGANSTSTLLERLTASTAPISSNPTPSENQTQFQKVQQIPMLSKNSSVITPLSSPPGHTLNVHTLNLAPFQGTINNIPGIQNLQSHPTSLIFSVAVTTATTTCTSVTPQVTSIATSSLGSNAVVFTNNTPPGSTSPVLPLPIAQLMASGVKGLTHQGLRVSSPNAVTSLTAGKSVQLVGMTRNAQIRGLLPAQRFTTAVKMPTNTTPAQIGNATLSGSGMNIASNSIVTLSTQQQQQLQLTLQKQSQYQQYSHNITPQQLQTCLNPQQSKTLSPAAVATKHLRRSNAADPNK